MLLKIDRIWRVFNILILAIISLSLFANNSTNSQRELLNCPMSLTQNFFAHISNSNQTHSEGKSLCLPLNNERQMFFDRDSFINVYIIPALIKEPNPKKDLMTISKHVLCENLGMLLMNLAADKNFTTHDALRVILPTTLSAGGYLLLEHVSHKDALFKNTHRALMLATIVLTSSEPLTKEAYRIFATDIGINIVLVHVLANAFKKSSQKSITLLSSLTILPVSLYAHDLLSTDNEEEFHKKVTNFKDELYISSLVGSFIPLCVELTLFGLFGVDPSLKSVALAEAISLVKDNLDEAKRAMNDETYRLVKASLDSQEVKDSTVNLFKSTLDAHSETLKNTLETSVDGTYYKLTGAYNLTMSDALSRVVSRIAVQAVNFSSFLGIWRLTKNQRQAHFLKYIPGLIYMALYTPSFY